jgi:hypothetical protein
METASSNLVRSQLQKILASDGFARNERLSAFLRFVVDQELSGQLTSDRMLASELAPAIFLNVEHSPVFYAPTGIAAGTRVRSSTRMPSNSFRRSATFTVSTPHE